MNKFFVFISRIFRFSKVKKSVGGKDVRYANKIFAAIIPLAEEYMEATGETKITIESGRR